MRTYRNTFARGLVSKSLILLAALALALGASVAWAGEFVPFKGNAVGAIVGAVPDPGGGGLLLSVLAEGNATSLGKFSRQEAVVFNPVTGSLAGTVVFTAANGDHLCGLIAGQFTSATTVAGAYTFTGGSGRFVNATGEAGFALVSPDGIHFSVDFDGRVSSVGANKK
jgi:hypothetical protein